MIYRCEICNKRLEGRKRKFCSNSCKCKYFYKNNTDKCNKWKRPKINNNCEVCGKPSGRKKYCSDKCKPKLIYTKPKLLKNENVLDVYNSKCYVCERIIFRIHIHHKDGNHNNNEEKNLIKLCPSCHPKVHNKKEKINRNYKLLKSGFNRDYRLKEVRSFLK